MFSVAPSRFRRSVALGTLLSVALLGGCSDSPSSAGPLAGSYSATVMRVQPAGEPVVDLLAGGATLDVTIGEDNTTSGLLYVPKALADEPEDLLESMAGTVEVSGGSLRFRQTADTFVKDLVWTVSGRTISVTNQTIGGVAFTITLTR